MTGGEINYFKIALGGLCANPNFLQLIAGKEMTDEELANGVLKIVKVALEIAHRADEEIRNRLL